MVVAAMQKLAADNITSRSRFGGKHLSMNVMLRAKSAADKLLMWEYHCFLKTVVSNLSCHVIAKSGMVSECKRSAIGKSECEAITEKG